MHMYDVVLVVSTCTKSKSYEPESSKSVNNGGHRHRETGLVELSTSRKSPFSINLQHNSTEEMATTGNVAVEVKQPGSSQGGQQWMAMPQMTTAGIPPGLEYLTQIDQLLIHQQIELFEALTDIETKNRYAIKNSVGQQVYFAYEESDFCHRICCGPGRGFIMHIVDNHSQEVIRLDRQFKCCAGCCWCADTECCSMEIQIQSPPGQVVGYCRQIGSKWKPLYEILDANKDVVLKVCGPCCACQTICCTGDVDFAVMGTDGVSEVGKISKQWGGFFREVITKADNFSCSFPMDLDVKMKANILGATFLIDYMFFEQKDNNS